MHEANELDNVTPYETQTFVGVCEKDVSDESDEINKKGEGLIIMQKEFEEWLLDIEERLNNICQTKIQVSSPGLLKVYNFSYAKVLIYASIHEGSLMTHPVENQ